ncbi:hypothetical protein [Streptomyces sp. NPDC054783]
MGPRVWSTPGVRALPSGPVTFLVDTYDRQEGVRIAARVRTDLGRGPGCAIRLDSCDVDARSRRSRALLDGAGLTAVRIVARGELDEYGVQRLVGAGAPIHVHAVGTRVTRVGVAADASRLDASYRLVECDGRPAMKLSSAKVTAPNRKQVLRRPGRPDVIALAVGEPPDAAPPLLRTVMRGGRRTWPPDHWQDARERFRDDIAGLPASARRIENPEPVLPVRSEPRQRLTASVRADIEARPRPEHRASPPGTSGLRDTLSASGPDQPRSRRGSADPLRGPMAPGRRHGQSLP